MARFDRATARFADLGRIDCLQIVQDPHDRSMWGFGSFLLDPIKNSAPIVFLPDFRQQSPVPVFGFATAPGTRPGAALTIPSASGSQAQMVVTIDSIDKDKRTVAVEGPDSSVETVSVANPANLKHVKVGDKIVVTLTNVVAIALEPESGNGP